MTTNFDTTAWLAEMRAIETEGERTPAQTYQGQPLINLGGVVLVTPETAAALAMEAA